MIRIPKPRKTQLLDVQKELETDAAAVFHAENEAYHNHMKQVAEIISNDEKNKIVMLCGPSSSGKTTSAHLLAHYLEEMGIGSKIVSLDDFYLRRDKLPKTPDGRIDFETVMALNIPLLKECLMNIIKNGYCEMPRFNFMNGCPEDKLFPFSIGENEIAIFEGIHALNPIIIDELPYKNIFKLYVSVRDGFFIGKRIIFSPREVRLMRRMIRDSKFRNSGAKNTLSMWTGVVMGEDKYIYPYKHDADVHVNSIHSFEPFIYKKELLELLSEVTEGDENYRLAEELISDLEKIEAFPYDELPENSLLREFVG